MREENRKIGGKKKQTKQRVEEASILVGTLPDWDFHNFRETKSIDWRFVRSLEMSIDEGSKRNDSFADTEQKLKCSKLGLNLDIRLLPLQSPYGFSLHLAPQSLPMSIHIDYVRQFFSPESITKLQPLDVLPVVWEKGEWELQLKGITLV